MTDLVCDLLIVGAGPGGYAAAARAGALGLAVVVVDDGPLGGACLNVGCIPSKCLIHVADEFDRTRSGGLEALGIAVDHPAVDQPAISLATAVGWKDTVVERLRSGVASLLDSAHVTVLSGRARIMDGKTVAVETADSSLVVRASNLVIATGSRSTELPHLPFGGPVLSSTDALRLGHLPERLAIVGAGYIGLELGTAFAKLGSVVSVVETEDRLLPRYDAALTAPVASRLIELGVDVMTSTRAVQVSADGEGLVVISSRAETVIPADAILVTVGRTPNLDGFGLESLGLAMHHGALAVDDQCRTSMRAVFAIGDATGEPMLAHRATAQGEMVAEIIAGHRRAWDDRVVPEVCFTDPEIVSVGRSPDDATADRIDHVVGRFSLRASGRALTLGRTDGFARVVVACDDRRVIGVQAVGAGVSEMAAAASLALEMGATAEDLELTIHAHPTLSEAVQAAARQAIARLGGRR